MKHLALSFGFLALAVLSGCSGAQRARSAEEVFGQMNKELAQALVAPDDAVGTTTVTSGMMVSDQAVSDVLLASPMPLPGERMSLRMPLPEDRMPLAQPTWGSSSSADIPETRD